MRYTAGTVSINVGSTTLTGDGTLWLANIPTTKGWIFRAEGAHDFYSILNVDSDTVITLGEPYAGESSISGASYVISNDYTYFFDLPTMNFGNVRWPSLVLEFLSKADAARYENKRNKPVNYIQFNPRPLSPTIADGILYYDSGEHAFYIYYDSEWRRLT